MPINNNHLNSPRWNTGCAAWRQFHEVISLSLLKQKIKSRIRQEKAIVLTFSVLVSILASVFFISLTTYGATTIGSNINTDGNLTVSGNATLGDNATDLIKSLGFFYASSTLQATGATRFYSTARIDGATTLNSVAYTWPSSDGSASTYLQTNGAGTLSWATVSSGSSSDWLKQTNFGVLNLTASTTIPYWAKDAIYASSTLQVQGLTTLANASTTQLTNSGFSWFNNLATFTIASTTGSLTIGDASADILTINAGTIQYLNSATTTIPQSINSWSIATSTSATPIFTINGSAGNIGIATTSPSSGLLSIENTGTGYTFYATDSANDTTPFVIDASGNVGVGTASPNSSFGMESTVAILVSKSGNSNNGIDDSSIYLRSGSPSLSFLDEGGDGTGYSIISNENYFSINTGTESSVQTVRMVITTTGNIGIGTTSPWGLLSIEQGSDSPVFVVSDQGTSTPHLLVDGTGKVGIGTTSPAEQLSVSGRLFVGGTGTSTIQNNLYVMGTLRSTVSYVGDLVFSNNFRFIEAPLESKIQSLFLQNQNGENIFKIDENGKLVVKEIEAENIQTKNIKSKQGNFEEKLKTKELQIGSPENRTGITIYDKDTGKPYCIEIRKGQMINKEGDCK